jgi:protein TonB
MLSLLLHVTAAALLLLAATQHRVRHNNFAEPIRLSIPLTAPRVARAAGGSNRGDTPARRGVAPPRALRRFVPPRLYASPKLPMQIAVAFDTPPSAVASTQFGDPYGKLTEGSLGRNGANGIGDKIGQPGLEGQAFMGPTTPPTVLYKVEPEFSEEARKAKYQGTVVLSIEVDASGSPRNVRVVRGAGLGLDEKAIEAVARWRFRPAQRAGRAVLASALIELSFHLL